MSLNKLSETELEKLKEYRLCISVDGQATHFEPLLDSKRLPETLSWLTGRIGAPNACVTSSILIKRMGFYAVLHFVAMTALEKKLNVDLKELMLVDQSEDTLWLPDFYLGDFELEEARESRDEWRDSVLYDVFARCLSPLIHLLKEQTRLNEKVMWENIAIYIHWIYGKLMKDKEIEVRAAADYHYIFHEADGTLFGDDSKNPLSSFADSEGDRQTCCLSYMLRKQEKRTCKTCPLKNRINCSG